MFSPHNHQVYNYISSTDDDGRYTYYTVTIHDGFGFNNHFTFSYHYKIIEFNNSSELIRFRDRFHSDNRNCQELSSTVLKIMKKSEYPIVTFPIYDVDKSDLLFNLMWDLGGEY